MSPEVNGPTVRDPTLPFVEKRLVEEAVVAKKLVVVAAEPVAFINVKFCRVVEPVCSAVEKVVRPVTLRLPPIVASPLVLNVPAAVLSKPTPSPPVMYPEPPTERAVAGEVVAIPNLVEIYV